MAIDPIRWRRLRPLLEQVLDLDPDRRTDFLEGLSGDDALLRTELEALLSQHTGDGGALDRGAAPAIAAVLAEPADDSSRVGQTIGRYRLGALLGSGGMGAVYLAERGDGGFAQKVALKLLRGSLPAASLRERFRQERQILAQLRHPNIAQLFDGGETDDGLPWFSLEYVDGVPITDYCRARELGLSERLSLLVEVAAALAYAHRNLVIHRDIKPSNILVEADGRVRLLDFGIAKLVGEGADTALTRHAFGPMTPEYAAPEQFRRGAITVATDVYQFGVLAFRLLTGRRPYRADPEDTLEWARAVAEEEPFTLPRALASVPDVTTGEAGVAARYRRRLGGDLDAIVRKALAKNPDDRYHSMDALIADVEAFLDGRPVRARRAGTLYFVARFAQRHRVPVAIALGAAALLLAVTAVALYQAASSQRAAARAKNEAERANAAVRFITSMFQVADPSVNRGEQLTANAILTHGANRLNSELTEQPVLRARLQAVIGQVHVALGDMARALPLFERAIDALRNDPGGDPLVLAQALERGAWAASRTGKLDLAVQWIEESRALTGDDDPAGAAIRVDALATLATIERDRMHSDRALALLEEALALSRRHDHDGDSERTARVRHRLVSVLADVGRHEEARAELERVRAAYARLFGADDVRLLRVDESDGWLRRQTGDLEGARAVLDRNSARFRALVGPRSAAAATNAYNRALVYRDVGELERAQAAFEEAADVWRETGAPGSIEVGWALSNAASTAIQRERHAEALSLLESTRSAWRDSMPQEDVAIGALWSEFARCYLALARYAEARTAAERASAILRKAAPASVELAEALRLLGVIEAAQGGRAADSGG